MFHPQFEAKALLAAARRVRLGGDAPSRDALAGGYRAAYRGTGIEYEESREYVPGDDVAAMDWKVTARLMIPGVFSGAILSWVTCVNELSCSIMLSTGKTSTLTIAAYTDIVRNSVGSGAALAAILTVTSGVFLMICLRVSKGKVKIV